VSLDSRRTAADRPGRRPGTTAARVGARFVLLVLAALVAGRAASSSAEAGVNGAGATPRTFTIFAVAKTIQFMNHEDDRRRGMTNNPFEVNRAKNLKVILKGTEKNDGPFPGDDVLYSFRLFENSRLTKRAGSAIFTCYYDVAKHATCDAYFDLADGSVLATGSVVFNAPRFRLSVGGGTSAYFAANGQVVAKPAARKAQRFDFQLK
jgi:hypothetical protein